MTKKPEAVYLNQKDDTSIAFKDLSQNMRDTIITMDKAAIRLLPRMMKKLLEAGEAVANTHHELFNGVNDAALTISANLIKNAYSAILDSEIDMTPQEHLDIVFDIIRRRFYAYIEEEKKAQH